MDKYNEDSFKNDIDEEQKRFKMYLDDFSDEEEIDENDEDEEELVQ